ncbi:TIGR02117 family protein [Flavobacterium sp. WW92]|uniref:TIGR02117 family protein n=1 Tax=unclassified Flavobacterium TaxID=196869 RepID=UPI00222548EA|nr:MULTISPECIES: TIGR02117 family protein [unclassified Flavobacterium]WDO12594.1 TIGR02117 family protein [Flavobacterium sp. WW92]
MKSLRKILRLLLKFLLGILAFFVLYIIVALVLPRFSVNSEDKNPTEDVAIYIKSNGVHTDIVVPIKTEYKDWSEKIKFDHIASKDATMQFIGFGWGDKGFYLNTPEWSDLKFSTAFNAAFYLGTSAMHATFFKQLKENEDCIKINISTEEYAKLIKYIEDSFQYDADGNPILIHATTYGQNDSFYEAKRKYSLFYTCNTWANNALKSADQKAAVWTPSDTGIFCHYR